MRNKRKTREEVFSTSTTPTANCHADANATTASASVFFCIKSLLKLTRVATQPVAEGIAALLLFFFFSPSLAPSNQREVSREL